MINIDTDIFDNDQGYEARGVVARLMPIGFFENGPLLREKIHRYLTMECGPGKPSFAARFVAQAKVTTTEKGSFLDASNLKPGQIVVSPGFIYEKIPWSTPLMNEHLKALKTYRRKSIIKAEVDKSQPAIDVGTIDPKNLTKQ